MAAILPQKRPVRLWLVRHGATAGNTQGRFHGHSDIPLSPAGEQQARALAQQFRGVPLAGVYSSDLLRARQTAAALTALTVQVSPLWREISFGEWEGLSYQEIAAQPGADLSFFQDALESAPPGGESLADLGQRILYAFSQLCQEIQTSESEDDRILVSHGGPLRVLLCIVLGMPLARNWQLQLATGSVSALDLSFSSEQELPSVSLALLNLQPALLRAAMAASSGPTSSASRDS